MFFCYFSRNSEISGNCTTKQVPSMGTIFAIHRAAMPNGNRFDPPLNALDRDVETLGQKCHFVLPDLCRRSGIASTSAGSLANGSAVLAVTSCGRSMRDRPLPMIYPASLRTTTSRRGGSAASRQAKPTKKVNAATNTTTASQMHPYRFFKGCGLCAHQLIDQPHRVGVLTPPP